MRPSILIVEDDEDFREALGEHLRAAGFWVLEAANGAEGLRALAEDDVDVILLDLRMPVMDGAEFCRRLEEVGPCVAPVVVMTAELDTREAGRFRCVVEVLRKPFDTAELDAAVAARLAPPTPYVSPPPPRS